MATGVGGGQNHASSSSANLWRQRRFWTRHASSWDHHAAHNPGLTSVRDAVLAAADLSNTTTAVDLGCGTGQLALQIAPRASAVIAIDISDAMLELLTEHAAQAKVSNITTRSGAMEHLELARESVDLVVSSYALHHLRDNDKQALVIKVITWLRPGGQLVIGDMMFGRGTSARDRAIIASKVRQFAKMGPGGWWRIVKNAARFLSRAQERPVSMDTWVSYLERAGFVDVHADPVLHEAAVVSGRRAPSKVGT